MAKSPWSCVLWDVDGTIADASAGIAPRIAQVLDEIGEPPVPADQINQWIGPPILESFERFAGLSGPQAREAVARYRGLAAQQGYASSVRLYDGVPELVRELHAARVPQSTASTKPQNQVAAILEHYGIEGCFEAIHGADPDPEALDTKSDVLGRALADLRAGGFDVSNPVLVGDRHHDIDGAAHHGVPVIFARWGFGSPAEESGAMAVVDSPAALRPLLLTE